MLVCETQERNDFSVTLDGNGQLTFKRFCIGCVESQLNGLRGQMELNVQFDQEKDIGVKFAGYMQIQELRAALLPVMQQSLDIASSHCNEFKICPKCNKVAVKLLQQSPFMY